MKPFRIVALYNFTYLLPSVKRLVRISIPPIIRVIDLGRRSDAVALHIQNATISSFPVSGRHRPWSQSCRFHRHRQIAFQLLKPSTATRQKFPLLVRRSKTTGRDLTDYLLNGSHAQVESEEHHDSLSQSSRLLSGKMDSCFPV
jgi:hypothetical protein